MIPAFNYAGAPGAPAPPPIAMPMATPMAAPVAVAPVPHPTPAHRGTLPPGTKVVVGKHMVVVQRYLAEGGFAHVYLVASHEPVSIPAVNSHGQKTMRPETIHVLKRMAVPDKQTLALVRGEVEAHVRILILDLNPIPKRVLQMLTSNDLSAYSMATPTLCTSSKRRLRLFRQADMRYSS